MLRQVSGKQIVERDEGWWRATRADYQSVSLDLGCGDGTWTYQYAKANPRNLVVGIDPDARSLEKISYKATRKPEKGGLSNLIFLQAAVESLPEDLLAEFDQIYINFPWGSLLGGIMGGELQALSEVSRVAADGCRLWIYTTYSEAYEPEMIRKLQLPILSDLNLQQLQTIWQPFSWQIERFSSASTPDIPKTSWWKTISHKRDREVFLISATKLEKD